MSSKGTPPRIDAGGVVALVWPLTWGEGTNVAL
jgi:hypothetical protein